MSQIQNPTMTLDELLNHCSNPASPRYDLAWREFLERYQRLIYNVVLKRINSWNHPNVRRDKQLLVDDIFSTVLEIFYNNGGRVLKNFQARDSESKFRSFVIVTSHRAAGRHLIKNFPASIVGTAVEEIVAFVAGATDPDLQWALYESVVKELRNQSTKRRGNLERDINIFLLYVWAGFDQQMIDTCPHLPDLGHRVVDLVVHRLRNAIRESWQDQSSEETP